MLLKLMFSNDNDQLYTWSQEQISERILSKRIYSFFGGLLLLIDPLKITVKETVEDFRRRRKIIVG